MYSYEELLEISKLKLKYGEKEIFEKRFEAILKKADELFQNINPEHMKTDLRDDVVLESRHNAEVIENAKNEEEGFIKVKEGYYGG